MQTDLDFLLDIFKANTLRMPNPSIANYIEGHRILPAHTPFPGPWINDKTPYLVEIMDNMAPYSGVWKTAVMKGAQIGFTSCAENVLAYYMQENPTACMYVTANDVLCKQWGTIRLEPLINSIGFRDKIVSALEEYKSKRTGDTVYNKMFPGGFLRIASAQSAASLRSDSIQVLITDEMDGCPSELRSGEGLFNEVVENRINAYGQRARVLSFSTPTTYEESLINVEFDLGDKRYYNVPCPYCNHMQPLVFDNLKPDMQGGLLVNAYYLCCKCGGAIFNNQKGEMLKRGQWIPTAKPSAIGIRSYQISSLYSPPGLESWTSVYSKYLKALNRPASIKHGMKTFTNLTLGLPFKETGSRPKVENVIELKGLYKSRTVPEGVLYITFGIDVQTGSETDPNNPPRLEMEICGHGANYRTWSIDYIRLEGSVLDAFDGAWEKLYWSDLIFKRADGRDFAPVLGFIDSGDGNVYDVVYRFCQRWVNTFPSKGYNRLQRRKDEDGDKQSFFNFMRYRAARPGKSDTILYEISTNHYKKHLYNNLKIQREPVGAQKPGFCDFPFEYPQRYFEMLTAEEMRADGSFHAAGRRNEALDCRVLNLCAADVWLDSKVMETKAAFKAQGYSALQLLEINHRYVLSELAKETGTPL